MRRDPGSPAFIDLGEAYLALGRPKDAISVGNVGLDASPDNLEGRVMIARAYAQLHQWKEAQGELLRVVKIDRSNRRGFALLGEILLRRNDFERAVPVLQHAQNLDPTSPAILAMLKRARSSQPLDPPPPMPTAMPPRGETNYNLEPPAAAPKARAAPPAPPAPPAAPPNAPTIAMPPSAPAPAPAAAHGDSHGHGPSKVVPSIEGVRPRVLSGTKPSNAAAASLRQSAAVGETYLNDLLTGGLLDVAGVRVAEQEFDLRPDRRWGRSTRRAFIFLFVVLVLGIGGGGGWYWYSEKQKAEAVARLQKEAKTAIALGDFNGLESGLAKLRESIQTDNTNIVSFALAAEVGGLEALLYGTDGDRVDQALKGARDIKPGQPGARELVIGKVAVELSRLRTLEAPATTLQEITKMIDEYLAKNEGDKWARWLKARTQLDAGDRKGAKASLKAAGEGEDGVVVALIDQADMLVDEGSLDEALALYDQALAKAKDHPLAVLGRSLARAESSVQSNDAIDDLNVKLDKNYGPRVMAYRNLALSLAETGIEDYPRAAEMLKKATALKPPTDPRFWARIGWAHYQRGEFAEAANSRKHIAWFGKTKAEDDPSVMLLDTALLVASGLPEKALNLGSKLTGVRASILRAYADLDLGKPKDAIGEMDEVLKKAPDNFEAQILHEQARVMASGERDKDRAAASEALEKLARKSKSKLGRHALGIAYLAIGNAKDAQPQLEQATTDINDESPNPLAYRSYAALANILLAANDIKGAGDKLDKALELNMGYFPTRALQAKIVLRNSDPDRALDLLRPLVNEQGALTPDAILTLAEALCTHKGVSQKDKDDAAQLMIDNKDKLAPPAEVGRVATQCDPKLPEKLGAPSDSGAAPKPNGGHRHHGR